MLRTVQIPFYHFCTVCCTRGLVLLLDYRKVACVLPQLAVSRCQDFWVSERKECSSSRPSSGPPAAFPAATLGWGRAGASGSRAEHREFSGLLLSVLLSSHCFCWESSGSKSQTPLLSLHWERESQNLPRQRGSVPPAFLFTAVASQQALSLLQVSHCLRFPTLANAQSSLAP